VSADLSIVICSLNGAAGVDRCLRRLAEQQTSARLEIIVVDDGSADDTSEVAARHSAIVIRHPANRGIAAARNSGIAAATAPVVAFLDDDCEPARDWAERLLAGYDEMATGVGGLIVPCTPPGPVQRYLDRHNPLQPLELSLASSDRLLYRLRLYLQRQWRGPAKRSSGAASPDTAGTCGTREVYSLVGANMSFRRDVLLAAGGFDERFRFAAEEVDLCLRLRRTVKSVRLVHVDDARMTHHFKPSLHDILRRSHAYGRGSARLYRKWPELPPTIFPGPLVVAAALALSPLYLPLLAVGAALPLVLYPQGLRSALTGEGLACLLDGYLQLGQETCEDFGFAEGWWLFRHLTPEPAAPRQQGDNATELTMAASSAGASRGPKCTP
jgi:glycosyltransferase involved in cell wall biosynthesis